MKKRILILLAVVLGCSLAISAQGRRSLRINEVMVQNDSCVVDEYGNRAAWIELFNSSFAPLEISSVFLTTDSLNTKMYPVPLGDVATKIPKRQMVLFFADSLPSRGTFHTNFVLHPGQPNWVAIYDADGRTLIDSVTIPADLAAGNSYARTVDSLGRDIWETRDDSFNNYITPASPNEIRDQNPKIQRFSEQDENGFGMTLMAMCIVFSALLVLCICFYIISKIGEKISKRKKMESQGLSMRDVPRAERPQGDSGEEIAAIVMALHDHLDAHDKESTILTINKVRRAYSPWSSKIYGLRQLPSRVRFR